jgi:hypothetical protein
MIYDDSPDLAELGASVYSGREVHCGSGGVLWLMMGELPIELDFPGYITA